MVKTRRMVSSPDGKAEGICKEAALSPAVPSAMVAACTPKEETAAAPSASPTTPEEMVNQLIQDSSITATKTKAGWCLREGLLHAVSVDNGRLFHLVRSQGLPSFYHSLESGQHEPTDNIKAPQDCFQSLCRIVAGQQLAGKAAQSIWKRLLETTKHNLDPATILEMAAENLETVLQKPAGLSGAKARSIVDLARHFDTNQLSEAFLTNPQSTEDDIRQALLKVKGLGPWSCDMFIMFHLEKPNVFPFGDLGVRKGVQKVFQLQGKGPKGSLCQKKDLTKVTELVEPYQPYQSLFTYYMWRAADTQDVYGPEKETKKKSKEEASTQASGSQAAKEETKVPIATTPSKQGTRKRKARAVTP